MPFASDDMRDHIVSHKATTDLRSAATEAWAARMSKNQLSRDFPGRSIFDFCNNIGTLRTSAAGATMAVRGGRADLPASSVDSRK